MILITGHVILTPEHRERMIALGAGHSARSRGEPGCLSPEPPAIRIYTAEDVTAKLMGA